MMTVQEARQRAAVNKCGLCYFPMEGKWAVYRNEWSYRQRGQYMRMFDDIEDAVLACRGLPRL